MGQRGTTKADLQSKLNAVADQMYRVTYEVKEAQVPAESGEDTDEAGRAAIPESEEEPEMETVEYVVCTIHPFDQSVILDAFGWMWTPPMTSSASPMARPSSICPMP